MITNLDKLTIPCAYQGGKQRIAKNIVDIIFKDNGINEETKFYDLCCGSGAISIELIKREVYPHNITMVDQSPWGLFWKMIGDGTFSTEVFELYISDIPKDITKIKDFAKQLISEPANDGLFENMVYKFLVLQACAFGSTATWVENNEWKKAGGLRNYWLPTETSSRRSHVNPMMPMPNTLLERVVNIQQQMEDVKGFYDDVLKIKTFENDSVVYIDPPYKDTTGYGFDLNVKDYVQQILNTAKSEGKKLKVYVSEGYRMTENAHLITSTRSKGGISGDRKTSNEEWLNVFN